MASRGRGSRAVQGEANKARADTQPIRPIPAAQHGDRKESVELQRAAPLSAGSGPLPTGPPQGSPRPLPNMDVFRPTDRPGEPITSGAALGPGPAPAPMPVSADPIEAMLSALYRAAPNDDVLELLMRARARRSGG